MISRAVALAAAAGLLLAGCGRPSRAGAAISATEHKLDDVRSGNLSLLLLASPAGAKDGTGSGFQIEGPFAVGITKGSLPTADLRYTRITGSQKRTTRFISTGDQAFVEVGGKLTALDEGQLAGLRVGDNGSAGGLDGLTLTHWLKDPQIAGAPDIDGAPTEQLTGRADAIAILNDVIGLTEQLGAAPEGFKQLKGDAADRVRRAVTGARAEVVTGRSDRLLRRASATVDLAVTDPKVRDALGDLAGARLALTLAVTNLNKPVTVAKPA